MHKSKLKFCLLPFRCKEQIDEKLYTIEYKLNVKYLGKGGRINVNKSENSNYQQHEFKLGISW